jgi:hypothetical protein
VAEPKQFRPDFRARVVIVPVSALHQGHGRAGGWTGFWTPNQDRVRPPYRRISGHFGVGAGSDIVAAA